MKPKTGHRRLELTGLANPGKTRGLMGTGLGETRHQSLCSLSERV
jgi:hypothetical protein